MKTTCCDIPIPQDFSGSGSCDIQDVHIAAGEILTDALVTNTESDGNYPNHACQDWMIIGDENQVNVVFTGNNTPFTCFNLNNHYILLFSFIKTFHMCLTI